MKELKRFNYKKLSTYLFNRGYDCYRMNNQDVNLDGFTSGLNGYDYINKLDFQLVLRKQNKDSFYIIEIDSNDIESINYTKSLFNQYNNIDYIMINGS